jgi:hypothetical protein
LFEGVPYCQLMQDVQCQPSPPTKLSCGAGGIGEDD